MAIDLRKKAETASIDLTKKGMAKPPLMACALALDVSLSMQGLYTSGAVQTCSDQVQGAALRLDDDGLLPTWTFDNRPYYIGEATEADGGTFVKNKVLRSPHLWGGTQYGPVLREITKKLTEAEKPKAGFLGGLFGKKPAAVEALNPGLVFFQTDGDNSDEREAMAALQAAAGADIFFQMIGVGGARFAFLKQAAASFPNVGFVNLSGLNNSDEAFYQAVLSDKFVAWAKKYPPRTA